VYEVLFEGETVIELVVAPVVHEYVEAPLAINVAVPPEQIVAEFTETLIEFPIFTFATSVPEQPLLEPVTV
jgi:hypothetical protein